MEHLLHSPALTSVVSIQDDDHPYNQKKPDSFMGSYMSKLQIFDSEYVLPSKTNAYCRREGI
jgi:hypothetical protein